MVDISRGAYGCKRVSEVVTFTGSADSYGTLLAAPGSGYHYVFWSVTLSAFDSTTELGLETLMTVRNGTTFEVLMGAATAAGSPAYFLGPIASGSNVVVQIKTKVAGKIYATLVYSIVPDEQ